MNPVGVSVRLLAASVLTIIAGASARTQPNPALSPADGVMEATALCGRETIPMPALLSAVAGMLGSYVGINIALNDLPSPCGVSRV